jgi:hypothetical protein
LYWDESVVVALVISGGDGPEVLHLAEKPFDFDAFATEDGVKGQGAFAGRHPSCSRQQLPPSVTIRDRAAGLTVAAMASSLGAGWWVIRDLNP